MVGLRSFENNAHYINIAKSLARVWGHDENMLLHGILTREQSVLWSELQIKPGILKRLRSGHFAAGQYESRRTFRDSAKIAGAGLRKSSKGRARMAQQKKALKFLHRMQSKGDKSFFMI